MTMTPLRSPDDLRLCTCDVRQCEALCCHDGAYLEPQEEQFLHELVARVPQLRESLPDRYIVDGYWDGEFLGRKTATRPQVYRNPEYPGHFPRTRCVFADAEGFCSLEKFARSRGQHPWTFKPAVCWLFPLQESDGQPEPPVSDPRLDPYRSPRYPGYATVVPCGRHDPAGRPWTEALARERAFLARARSLPVLGSVGHGVDELLAAHPQDPPDP
ncbi:MAG TPA: hypothetical protein VMF03_21870 [Steroidobacteraceae bacterium]|nr:hypothetical protein [Steroidobacteraceae bacterium]